MSSDTYIYFLTGAVVIALTYVVCCIICVLRFISRMKRPACLRFLVLFLFLFFCTLILRRRPLLHLAMTTAPPLPAPRRSLKPSFCRHYDQRDFDLQPPGPIHQPIDDLHNHSQNLRLPEFNANFRNPCWLEHIPSNVTYCRSFMPLHQQPLGELRSLWSSLKLSWRLRCLPYFYVAGFPKCSTTDVFFKIAKHPEVARPPMKEPHWWTRRSHRGDCQKRLQSYVELFDTTAFCIQTSPRMSQTDHPNYPTVFGDGSASTIWDNINSIGLFGDTFDPRGLTLQQIQRATPEAKFIVMTREPADRFYSDYLFFRRGKKSLSHFHQVAVRAIAEFSRCRLAASLRRCVYVGDNSSSSKFRTSISLRIGLYWVYLVDFLKVFRRDQLLVVSREDYDRKPRLQLQRIFHFLKLSPLPERTWRKILTGKRLNTRHYKDRKLADMLPETKRLLQEFYRPHNRDLTKVLGNDKFIWRDHN